MISAISPHTLPCLLSQGDAYCQQGSYNQAHALFEQVLHWSRANANLEAEIQALQRIGNLHLAQHRTALALATTSQALTLAQGRADHHAHHTCHRQLAHIYKQMAQFQLALHHLEQAEALQADIFHLQAQATRHSVPCPGYSPLPSALCTVLAQLPLGVALFQQNRLVYANPQFLRWANCPPEEALTRQFADFFDVPACPGTPGGQSSGRGQHPLAPTCQCQGHLPPHGKAMAINCRSINLSTKAPSPTLLVTVRGMEEQMALADELGRIKAHYYSTPVGLCRLSPLGAPLKVNPALVTLLGYPDLATCLTQALPVSPVNLSPPSLWGALTQAMACHGPLYQQTLECCRADGHSLWVRASTTPIHDDQGDVLYYEGVIEDITGLVAVQTALADMAVRDALTQVYNRRHFMELARREVARAHRTGHSLSLVMLDLDHFKTINDTYGHPAGDEVLRRAVNCLRTSLRQSDILARYGGEEFVILLPETDHAQAQQGAERLRSTLAQHPFLLDHGPLPVTASLGVATWTPSPLALSPTAPAPSTAAVLKTLIQRADQALYAAKQQGRNCTVVYACPG